MPLPKKSKTKHGIRGSLKEEPTAVQLPHDQVTSALKQPILEADVAVKLGFSSVPLGMVVDGNNEVAAKHFEREPVYDVDGAPLDEDDYNGVIGSASGTYSTHGYSFFEEPLDSGHELAHRPPAHAEPPQQLASPNYGYGKAASDAPSFRTEPYEPQPPARAVSKAVPLARTSEGPALPPRRKLPWEQPPAQSGNRVIQPTRFPRSTGLTGAKPADEDRGSQVGAGSVVNSEVGGTDSGETKVPSGAKAGATTGKTKPPLLQPEAYLPKFELFPTLCDTLSEVWSTRDVLRDYIAAIFAYKWKVTGHQNNCNQFVGNASRVQCLQHVRSICASISLSKRFQLRLQ